MQMEDMWDEKSIPDEMLVRLVLEEDTRRMEAFHDEFDPESGKNAPGDRVWIRHEDLLPRCQNIPKAMFETPEVKDLLAGKHITEAFHCRRSEKEKALGLWHRLRCLHDFPYWAFKTIQLTPKDGGTPFYLRLNAPQRKLTGVLEEMRLARQPIRTVIVKARQWGGSTLTQVYMLWIQLMRRKGFNSLIISHQAAGTEEILNMATEALMLYPRELLADPGEEVSAKERPYVSGGFSRSAIKVPRRNCRIKVGSAERPDSSRGGAYSLVHLSEVGLWRKTGGKRPEDVVRAATSGVLLEPETMVVMESTADGVGSFFHKEYLAAKRGTSLYRLVFVGWHEIEKYSLKLSDSEREAFARNLVEGRLRGFSLDDRMAPGAYLWGLWRRGVRLEALAWYVKTRGGYGSQDQMAAEYPGDDTEAFVCSDVQVFSSAKVEALRDRCCPPIDTGRLTSLAERGERSLLAIEFESDPKGTLHIWEMPDTDGEGEARGVYDRYLTVVDVGGRSAKADWSVIAVFDRIMMVQGSGPSVVAQWRGHCDMDILAWEAARIAKWYGNSLLVIESNTMETRDRDRVVDGDQSKFILNQIRDCYDNLYARKASPEDIALGLPTKYGFHTNVSTKPMIISNLVMAVREGLYTERDENCLNEYLTYRRRANGSYAAESGHHDDLLMTRAIGLHIAFSEMDAPIKKSDRHHDVRISRPYHPLGRDCDRNN